MSTTFPRNPTPDAAQVALIRGKLDVAQRKYKTALMAGDSSAMATWYTEQRLMHNWLWAYAPEALNRKAS